MKRVFVSGLFAFIVSLPAIGKAATVGNPADVLGERMKSSIGLETDGILNKRMGLKRTIPEYRMIYPQRRQDVLSNFKLKSNRNFIKFTLGYLDNADVYLKVGFATSTLYLKDNNLGQDVRLVGKYDIAWGAGSKIRLYNMSNFKILADVQYLRYTHYARVRFNEKEVRGVFPKITINEGQASLLATQKFNFFSPYGGMKYSYTSVLTQFTTVLVDVRLKPKNYFGVFAGTDIHVISNKLKATIEGRFIDETAVTAGVTYIF